MDLPTRPGDALAQPTRARLFALLGELRRPAATEELAERLGLHRNGVRAHLERLRDAGLVDRASERRARGRPRDTWRISADARPGGDPPTAYADLSRWLVRAMSVDGAEVEAIGREIGRELAAQDEGSAGEQRMYEVLVALGFQPRRERGPGGLRYSLGNCPYREAVRERQPLVCGLHRGITRGLLDVIDPDTELAGFVPEDPYTAGCVIELRGGLAAEGAVRRPGPPPARAAQG